MKMSRPKAAFEFFVDQTMKGLRYFWRLRDGNDDVLAVSRDYGARSSALRAAKRMKDIVTDAEIRT